MTETLFALVLVICTTTGECHEAVLGVYDTKQDCVADMYDQRVHGECYPVEGVISTGDDQRPATR
ncbi:DUF1482 family protein [Pectobacterium sp. A535-S3-A17]|uniref:DUF1482 family protein n=1 Tax=Pectobacterium quasiaquaticum TaxID=2774015 RepID=A0A9Q2EWI9_9GAMM|nr:DUF1482 family protein [Pectobacterium quasiaquaticum]MBE5213240.1 DUF1482 family protein [Pectobacterium quasiaquaticum]MBE5221642.1 DUF1482 family protein [Pectobacterium quasiaquaticum]MBE5224109.1 DUF1482 family protein [Pectobacterium quasiaquaticum]URG50586.1 DUF1482 family protein [Pectobacterium quasiaquaticum]